MNADANNEQEIIKFNHYALQWWDREGPLKTLHDINPVRLAFILQFGALHGKAVLDIGCGGGILTEAMAKEGAQVVGLDKAPDSIQVAKQHAVTQGLAINYCCQDLAAYPLQEFDVVTCMELLEHVADPQLIIEQAAARLKRGGLLFLSTINRTWQAYLTAIVGAEYVFKLLPKQTHCYDQFIKPSELTTMLRQVGCQAIELKGLGYNPFSRQAYLKNAVEVNYLLVAQKL